MHVQGVGEVKILELSHVGECSEIDSSSLKPGDFVFHKKRQRLLAFCIDGCFVEITKLTLVDKKKAMNGVDLNNGFLKKLKLCVQV